MIKSFLIFISFTTMLFASQQLILVVADGFDATHAKLEFYEDSTLLHEANVTLGSNGLAWGSGEIALQQNAADPQKKEGDKRSPAGIFKLPFSFGYEHTPVANLPYLYASKELICVDDTTSPLYNNVIIKEKNIQSFEWMHRDDGQYRYGVMVGHNPSGEKKRGSCIFLHIQKTPHATTAGCTAMTQEDILKLLQLLDRRKNPLLIQIPKSAAGQIRKLYPQLQDSNLLHPHQNHLVR